VTITGNAFAVGATVIFGANAATNVTVLNSTTISATSPAGAVGTVAVTVTNSTGRSGSLSKRFYLYREQSRANRQFDHTQHRHGEWRYRSDHHGHGLPYGSDGDPGRDGGDERERRGQRVDHGNHAGACRWRSERPGH